MNRQSFCATDQRSTLRRLVRFLVITFFLVAVSGCLTIKERSDGTDILITHGHRINALPDEIRFFAESVGRTSSEEKVEYALLRVRPGEYSLARVTSDGSRSEQSDRTRFRRVHDNFYIAQVEKFLTSTAYMLVEIDQGQFSVYSGYEGSAQRSKDAALEALFAPRAGATGRESSIDGIGELGSLFNYVIEAQNEPYITRRSYDFYDMSDKRDVAALAARRSQGATTPKSARSPEADDSPPAARTVGAWRFEAETDPITDEVKRYIYGVPSSQAGVRAQPVMRIGCYASDMGITLAWGEQLRSLYPNGDVNAVGPTASDGQGTGHC